MTTPGDVHGESSNRIVLAHLRKGAGLIRGRAAPCTRAARRKGHLRALVEDSSEDRRVGSVVKALLDIDPDIFVKVDRDEEGISGGFWIEGAENLIEEDDVPPVTVPLPMLDLQPSVDP
jgi:hypothetical protein